MFAQVRPRRIKRLQCKNGHWVDPMRQEYPPFKWHYNFYCRQPYGLRLFLACYMVIYNPHINQIRCKVLGKFIYAYSGAPNDQFVVKCIIIPQLMKINVIKAFSDIFQCCWENIICSFFPARHTRNFPAS